MKDRKDGASSLNFRRLAVVVSWMLASMFLACAPPASDPTDDPSGSEEVVAETAPPSVSEADQGQSDAPSDSLRNVLEWSTASEVENFGFDVYRSESEDGPFERVTEEPLTGAGTTDEIQTYEFVDPTNDPAKAYYYYIESISMDNVRERFTPVIYAKPKIETAE